MRTDTDVLGDVVQELHWDPMITAEGIGATVRDGIVTLVGHVPSYAEKRAAEEIAARVEGVRAVVLELEVRPPTAAEISDAELATRAAQAIEWNVFVPQGCVTIYVERGTITLTGTVPHEHQRAAAERALCDLSGLRGLTNNLVVAVRTSPRDIARAAAENALTRRGDFHETVP